MIRVRAAGELHVRRLPMRHKPSLVMLLSAGWILASETVRFLVAEFRAGHRGNFGLAGYRWLANQLLSDRYNPRRKRVIAEFVLFAARKRRDEKAIEIAKAALADVRTHPYAIYGED